MIDYGHMNRKRRFKVGCYHKSKDAEKVWIIGILNGPTRATVFREKTNQVITSDLISFITIKCKNPHHNQQIRDWLAGLRSSL